ncbi:hypothetical protein OC834_006429 [Tilletia horrida]|nr:hypothetical protein OC834_006429 [Tilletia horrida]
MRCSTFLIFATALAGSLTNALAVPAAPQGTDELHRRGVSTVIVKTANRGSFRGLSLGSLGQDQFNGIRYVQPITSANRFQRATALSDLSSSVIHDATQTGPLCIQSTTSNLLANEMSEDCLTMQIIRPQGIPANSPVPVLVFFHGGGWAHGGSTFPIYNGTELVAASVLQNQPVIYVNLNYRLGIFGFLGGKQMQQADAQGTAALNAGYWDQHDALQFVQENIGAFGGDPTKVTIWGQSAGAASVAAHLLANGGKSGASLFSRAVLESGSAQLYPRYDPTASRPQQQFNTLLKATSCSSLDCLRGQSTDALAQANIDVVRNGSSTFSPTLDSYFHTIAPSKAVQNGAFADVPILMGTNLDDGTFVQACTVQETDADLLQLFQSQYGSTSVVKNLLATYPDQAPQGCPFRPVLYGVQPTDRFYGFSSQYKRCAAIETDLLFTAGKRAMLSAAARFNKHKAFGYLWAQRTAVNGDPAKGVTHSCELGMIFARPTLTGQSDAAARQYASSADIESTTSHIVTSLLTFAYKGDPNARGFPSWPAYDDASGSAMLMQFEGTYNTTLVPDTFRGPQVAYLQSQAAAFGV